MQNKPQQIQENSNHIKHLPRLQRPETRNQPQGKKTQKHSNSWRLNSMLLNNEWVNNEFKEEIKKFLEINENEHRMPQTYGTQRRQF